ncbi:MAG: hypothetical protein OEU92_09585 [Alphaproteobacteria bacterium]|nr:hypothetical protein [Alphaproteobacteria bacterium]
MARKPNIGKFFPKAVPKRTPVRRQPTVQAQSRVALGQTPAPRARVRRHADVQALWRREEGHAREISAEQARALRAAGQAGHTGDGSGDSVTFDSNTTTFDSTALTMDQTEN